MLAVPTLCIPLASGRTVVGRPEFRDTTGSPEAMPLLIILPDRGNAMCKVRDYLLMECVLESIKYYAIPERFRLRPASEMDDANLPWLCWNRNLHRTKK